ADERLHDLAVFGLLDVGPRVTDAGLDQDLNPVVAADDGSGHFWAPPCWVLVSVGGPRVAAPRALSDCYRLCLSGQFDRLLGSTTSTPGCALQGSDRDVGCLGGQFACLLRCLHPLLVERLLVCGFGLLSVGRLNGG